MKELLPISADYLYAGMKVEDDIYNYNGKVILVPKGEILGENKLLKLIKFNSGKRNISVKKRTFEQLIEHKKKEESTEQKELEAKVGYKKVTNSMESYLNSAKYTGKIESKEVLTIKEEIANQIEHIDINCIVQCIYAPRQMDEYLQKHSVNVSLLNGLIGKWMGLSGVQVSELIMAGVVHDVGKTQVPAEVLDLPRRLTAEEFAIVKKHPEYSYELLQQTSVCTEKIMLAVKYHHERFDGSGYPAGLRGEETPLYARITAVSDVYDALVSKRSYKEERNPLNVMNMLYKNESMGLDVTISNLLVQRLLAEYIGREVVMSDATEGRIVQVLPNDLEHPIIDIDGVLRQATDEWKCERLLTHM